jgi:hypothetical protein
MVWEHGSENSNITGSYNVSGGPPARHSPANSFHAGTMSGDFVRSPTMFLLLVTEWRCIFSVP